MRIVDLKTEPRFLGQYIELRNHYAEILLTAPVSEEETREWIRTADIEVKGVAQDDTLLGAAILYADRDGEIAFFVKKRNQGTGSALLRVIEDAAKERGLRSVWGWVLLDNAIARRVFEKNGFAPCEEDTRGYRGERKRGITYRKRVG